MDLVCDKKQFPFVFAALECLEEQCHFTLRSLQEPSIDPAIGVMCVRDSSGGRAAVRERVVRQVTDLASIGAVKYIVVVIDSIRDTEPEVLVEFVKDAINDESQTFLLCLDNQLARKIEESLYP